MTVEDFGFVFSNVDNQPVIFPIKLTRSKNIGQQWIHRNVCRNGHEHYSRALFKLFSSLD